jgi:hypothetical protein
VGGIAYARCVFDIRSTASILSLLRGRVIDAELGSLLWLLGEGGAPITVASTGGDGDRASILAALDDLVPPSGPRPVGVRAGSLADVLAKSNRRSLPMVGASPPPEAGPRTGVVLILERPGAVGDRIVAAHLVRPPMRDAGGHVQRPGPAVLATWDERAGRWDHFAWGIAPELAAMAGLKTGDVEPELARRTEYLAALAETDIVDAASVRSALHGYHHGAGPT